MAIFNSYVKLPEGTGLLGRTPVCEVSGQGDHKGAKGENCESTHIKNRPPGRRVSSLQHLQRNNAVCNTFQSVSISFDTFEPWCATPEPQRMGTFEYWYPTVSAYNFRRTCAYWTLGAQNVEILRLPRPVSTSYVHECPWTSMVHDYESFLFCFRPGEAIKGAYCLTCWSSWSFRTRVPRIGVLFVWTLAWLALKHIDTVDTVDISVQVESLEASNSIQFLQSMKRSSGWGVPLLLVAAVVWTILGWSSKADGATWHDVLKFWNSLLVLECLDGFVHSNCKPRGSVCA